MTMECPICVTAICVRSVEKNVYYHCPVCKEMWNGCALCLAIIDDIPRGGETCKFCGRLYCEFCYHNYRGATSSGQLCDQWRCVDCARAGRGIRQTSISGARAKAYEPYPK